jgi:predicted permease
MLRSTMATLLQDIQYGWRMITKSPMASLIVVITLALGIGANTFVFSMVNGYLLRPLHLPHPEQIAVIATRKPSDSPFLFSLSFPDLQDFRKQAAPVADVFGYQIAIGGLNADRKADQFLFNYVTGNYFTALGVKPLIGRLITPEEENQPGKQSPVVLGYTFWQKRFGGDPRVVGKEVTINGKPATIVGVVPKDFRGAWWIMEMDAYVPLGATSIFEPSTTDPLADRNARILRALARLKPGVSFSQAQASFDVIAARLDQQYPSTDKGLIARVYREQLARPQPLGANVAIIAALFFLVLAALLLLLACMNVANLVLARATVRQREMGLRAALGAARGRLIRQMLTESLVLAAIGGLGGILTALWFNPGTLRIISSNLPISVDFGFDWKVFAYAFGVAIFSGVLVGIWPALRASRVDLNTVLQEGGRGDSGGPGRHRVRDILVAAQVAGSLTLLVIAGLFLRSVANAGAVQLGFNPDHVLTVTVDPHEIGWDEARTKQFYRDLETRVRALPGVQSASLSFAVPMSTLNSTNLGYITVEGQQLANGEQAPSIFFNNVGTSYFSTMQVPVVRGRVFTDFDDDKSPLVAVVNQAMADRYWPNQDPIGKRFTLANIAGPKQLLQIVGVVATGKYLFIAESPTPFFFVPNKQNFVSEQTLAIRTSALPESFIVRAQGEIRSLAPDLPVMDVETMDQIVAGTNGMQVFRIAAVTAAILGAIGLILASVGVYGVVSFSAAQRTREIGIRMALGGAARDVLRLVIQQGVRMVGVGLLVGIAVAWGLTRLMARLLIGVSPSDPATYGAVILLLSAIAFLACWLPARRATRIDPGIALRYE